MECEYIIRGNVNITRAMINRYIMECELIIFIQQPIKFLD